MTSLQNIKLTLTTGPLDTALLYGAKLFLKRGGFSGYLEGKDMSNKPSRGRRIKIL